MVYCRKRFQVTLVVVVVSPNADREWWVRVFGYSLVFLLPFTTSANSVSSMRDGREGEGAMEGGVVPKNDVRSDER